MYETAYEVWIALEPDPYRLPPPPSPTSGDMRRPSVDRPGTRSSSHPSSPPFPPLDQWRLETSKCGSPWNPILITPIFQTVLTTLNYMWSMDLLRKSLAGKGRLKQL